jgi:hypothetical protein
MPNSDNDGWIEWNGGECPVAHGTLVVCRYRDGDIESGLVACELVPDRYREASRPFWRHDDANNDIVAYRLHIRPHVDLSTASTSLGAHRDAIADDLTTRDWFAGMALQGMLSYWDPTGLCFRLRGQEIAAVAFTIADAMMAEYHLLRRRSMANSVVHMMGSCRDSPRSSTRTSAMTAQCMPSSAILRCGYFERPRDEHGFT